jgi:lysophospholipase L1-like esterase
MQKTITQMKKTLFAMALLLLAALPATAQTAFVHPWQGKRVAYFGDSVTDPRNKAANKKYWAWLQDWLGITPYVYGVSGRQWNDIPRQTAQLLKEHGDTVDAILIFCGTNDYNNGVPLGQWWDEHVAKVEYGHGTAKQMVTRRQRTPSMDPTTYRGRINIALDSLKRTYPTKQIVLLTPLHRSNFFANEKNWQCDESYTNQCGEYIDAYVQATLEAAHVWAVPVIDWNATSGLFPLMKQHGQYFNRPDNGAEGTDLLHPNNQGHQRLAHTLMQQLLALPCTF